MDGPIAERYRDFATYARGDSATFERWALALAEDPELHAWLADLPRAKQQPNLVFAAARWHGAPAPGEYAALKAVLLEQERAVKDTIRTRATQTNEVGRLTSLTPVLGTIGGPLALVEVGASAGLCLLPDRYDYAWSGAGTLTGSGGPTLSAATSGPVPVPAAHPDVVWRAGVDLNPLDVTDDDAAAWLEILVWPEQDERRARLRAALEVTRREPPYVVRGDLREQLPALLAEAGRHGTPVVFHSAVAAYLADAEREILHDEMAALVADGACHWISNEAPHVLPRVTGENDPGPGRFVLALDGLPVGFAHGHGHSLEWLHGP